MTDFLLFIWNFFLAVAVLNFIVRYKLEIGSYFASSDDLFDSKILKQFMREKWQVLTLVTVFLGTYVLLTKDTRRWKEQAQKCFSATNIPSRWRMVRGRWIIAWVVPTNVLIFLALAYYTDNIKAFSALFMIHHANAVAWIIAFRWNVQYYFYNSKYVPDDNDQFKDSILRRRRVMERFLCKTRNIEREGLTAIAYGCALAVSLVTDSASIMVRMIPYLIVVAAEAGNQYFSYLERRERNRELRKIAKNEEKVSSADRKRRSRLKAPLNSRPPET